MAGETVGEHVGLAFYTLGQRQGLGIGGVSGTGSEPWYVAKKDHDRNVLVVVQGRDDPLLYSQSLRTGPMQWINQAPRGPLRCQVSSRYRQSPADALLTPSGDLCSLIEFDGPQWAVTPGQYAVVYDGDRCLGGGVIMTTTTAQSVKSAV